MCMSVETVYTYKIEEKQATACESFIQKSFLASSFIHSTSGALRGWCGFSECSIFFCLFLRKKKEKEFLLNSFLNKKY